MKATAGKGGLLSLSFIDSKGAISKDVHPENFPGNAEVDKHLDLLEKELKHFFEGKLHAFSVALDLQGTAFQTGVWQQLLQIEYGKTITYQQQAFQMNKSTAIRAIAAANGQNPVAVVVPCHRVIGSDFSLTGYAGGIHRKKWLLDFEKKNTGQTLQLSLFN